MIPVIGQRWLCGVSPYNIIAEIASKVQGGFELVCLKRIGNKSCDLGKLNFPYSEEFLLCSRWQYLPNQDRK
jgi:hypothetical protein